jgi:hypothetical protein
MTSICFEAVNRRKAVNLAGIHNKLPQEKIVILQQVVRSQRLWAHNLTQALSLCQCQLVTAMLKWKVSYRAVGYPVSLLRSCVENPHKLDRCNSQVAFV